jgi:hypothetical protein
VIDHLGELLIGGIHVEVLGRMIRFGGKGNEGRAETMGTGTMEMGTMEMGTTPGGSQRRVERAALSIGQNQHIRYIPTTLRNRDLFGEPRF